MNAGLRIAVASILLTFSSLLFSCGGASGARQSVVPTSTPPPALTIATTTLTSGTVGIAYSATINAAGGVAPYGWSVTAGALPHNLALSSSTRNSATLAGTPDTAQQGVTFTVTVTDSAKQSAAQTYVVSIGAAGGGAISVNVSAAAQTAQAGDAVPMTATVANDASAKGVTWSLSPATGAGSLASATSASVVFKAPATPPASDTPATITASSVADTSKSASATVTTLAITLSVSPGSATVVAGAAQAFSATVNNDPTNAGVTWLLTPASGAGTLSNATGTTVTYNAPTTAPANSITATLIATSVTDSKKSVSVNISVPIISISLSLASALIPTNVSQQFGASVTNDAANAGVTWTLAQNGIPCSPACGNVSPAKTGVGIATTYTAPATAQSAAVTLIATSVTDKSKSASATITISTGTVKLVPASLNFGTLKFTLNRNLPVTLTNTGVAPLTITDIHIIGANTVKFAQTNDCGTSVAPGASCKITVNFRPQAVGSFTASVQITDSSTESPQLIALSGSGGRQPVAGAAVMAALTANRVVAAPAPTGPNVVGTRVLDLVDSKRDDPFLESGNKRELLVRMWYPAASEQTCKPAPYTSPKVWARFSQLLRVALPAVTTNSCLDNVMADGLHPVVIFTHGYTGTFTDYTYLFEDLASRGYVVASVNHTYEATAAEFPDGRFVASALGSHLNGTTRTDEQALSLAASTRVSDVRFVLDTLQQMNTSRKGFLAGKLDLSSIALAGHSMGGLTVVQALAEDTRFHAGVVLDGVPPNDALVINSPVLIISAGAEQTSDSDCAVRNGLFGPKFAVSLDGAEHITPSDAVWLAKHAVKTGTNTPEQAIAAIRDQVAAFLAENLTAKAATDASTLWPAEPNSFAPSRKQTSCDLVKGKK